MKQEFADYGALAAAAVSIPAARAAIDAEQAGGADRRLRPQRCGDRAAIRRGAARTRRRAAGGDDQRLDRPRRRRGAARLRPAVADQAGRSARAALDADRRARTMSAPLPVEATIPSQPLKGRTGAGEARMSRPSPPQFGATISNYSNEHLVSNYSNECVFCCRAPAPSDSQGDRTAGLDPASPETPMTARRAFAPAILLAVSASPPRDIPDPIQPPSALPRSDDERALADLQLLGKRLFEDTNLSEPKGVSLLVVPRPQARVPGQQRLADRRCRAGQPPRPVRQSQDADDHVHGLQPGVRLRQGRGRDEGENKLEARGGQFWDGRASDLVEQPAGPLMNPAEMNNPSADAVVDKVKAAAYAPMMTAVFGPDAFADPKAAFQRISQSLFAYEASARFAPFASKFDDYSARQGAALAAWRRAGWRCSSTPSAAIASPATPARQTRRTRPTGCSPTSPMTRSAFRATRRSPPTPTR